MSSDLVKRFPMLGDCNREVNGVCRNRSCLVRGGWVKGQPATYDAATCEARDVRLLIEALESEVSRLKKTIAEDYWPIPKECV